MSVPYIHTFYTPKGYYFYDFNTNAIVRINKSVYDFLNEWEKNKDCPNSQSECGNIIDELKRAGFLSERHWTKIEHPATKMLDRYLHSSVESITLQVTQQCNLKCNYCPYSGSYYNREHSNRHMSFETAKQAIDFYIAHSFDIPVAHIGFYGGEPLIEYDLIRKIVEYCREKCFGKKIMYFMTTNATLLTEEVIDFLMENEFNLSISLDGPRNYHDRNRHRIDDSVGIQTKAPTPGDTAAFGECEIQFLGPYEKYNDTNDNSICLKVKHGETSMLFTGDAGSSPEKKMIEMGEDLEADLLQAGHHGSSTSNSYYFLREANPEYVVISCGKGNMYGHPHEEALSRFRDLGAEVFRTDEQGTIIAVDDGMQITFNCEGKKSERTHVKDYEDASYIGNINSKKYHLPSCSGLPNEENRVYFTTIDAAEKAGYSPCGNCHPDR